MAKGQVTIQKEVRKALGVTSEDFIFIVKGSTVHIVKSAVYSMRTLQRKMTGEAEQRKLTSDDGVMIFVKELRNL